MIELYKEEVMKMAMEHGNVAHADMMKDMTKEQMASSVKSWKHRSRLPNLIVGKENAPSFSSEHFDSS